MAKVKVRPLRDRILVRRIEEKEKKVGLDVLFTYMLNPGTALYVGYTDLYENYRLNPLESPELYRTISPDLNTARQFFVKLSYLLRF